MVDLSVLRGDCDGQAVISLVGNIFESHEPLELASIMTIVQKVIPFYPSLGPIAQDQLVQIIERSYTFFSQLVSFVLSMKSDQREVKIFRTVILEILRRGKCIHQYIREVGSQLERSSVVSLFFGSKLFNVLVSEISILEYLEILKIQWENLFKESTFQDPIYGNLFVSMIILHPTLCPDVIFGQLVFVDDNRYNGFKVLVKNATLLDQRRILRFLLLYLQLHTNFSNYRSVWSVLEPLPFQKAVDLDTVLSLRSDILQEIVLRLISRSQNSRFVLPLIRRFAECSSCLDGQVCQILVIMLRLKMDSDERKAVSRNSSFMNAVTKRLAHEDAIVRERTMYIAKVVTDGQLQYDSDFFIAIPDLDFSDIPKPPDYASLRDFEPSLVDASKLSSLTPPTQELAKLEISQELEPIVFVKDLLKKFESQENKLLVPLLQSTVRLVRQKRDFPLEVGFYSSPLLLHISTLNNNTDEKNFEDWRVNALVSLLVVTPEKVQDLQRILFNSELSLQQRISVLTSIGFAARELRGFDNGSTIITPHYDFPTKRLPWDNPSARKQLLEEYPESKSALTSSQSVWRSKKLDKPTQGINENCFRNHAHVFFYPLVHGWLNGIDLGTYDKLFKRHYMRITTIVYQCCHPHKDYDEMTEIMLQLTSQALQQGIDP